VLGLEERWHSKTTRYLGADLGLKPELRKHQLIRANPCSSVANYHSSSVVQNPRVSRLKSLELLYRSGMIDAHRLQQRMDALLSFTSHAQCRQWRRRMVLKFGCLSEDDI
jgi:hypothetical protein